MFGFVNSHDYWILRMFLAWGTCWAVISFVSFAAKLKGCEGRKNHGFEGIISVEKNLDVSSIKKRCVTGPVSLWLGPKKY